MTFMGPMTFDVSAKFELNLIKSNPVMAANSATYAIKNRIPVIVVPPNLFMPVLAEKQRLSGNYKVIAAIDFDNLGKNYAMDKIKTLPRDILAADGWDILITPGKSMIETSKEMSNLSMFLKQGNQLTEIRWTISCRAWSREIIDIILEAATKNPVSFIRTDFDITTNTKAEEHEEHIKLIRNKLPTPIKISGNVNWELFKKLRKSASRFDVSIDQARSILSAAKVEAEKPPEDTKETEKSPVENTEETIT